jgi:OOP family OmpA-OmpF porin
VSDAFAPFVEKALHTSVRRNPAPLIEILVPVLGPAIRKSIGEALRGMIQALDQALQRSFSVEGMRWRLESWRLGKPFGEIVLRHCLIYRVEAALLVHRETGLLLHQVAKGEGPAEPQLVAAMSIALQDFVRESFEGEAPGRFTPEGELRTIQAGELLIWIEHTRQASLVVIIRGHPPEALRTRLEDALHELDRELAPELETFVGSTAPFERADPPLRALLEEQLTLRSRRPSKAYVLLGALMALMTGLVGIHIRRAAEWGRFIRQFEGTPGIVVTGDVTRGKRHLVSGLRDSYAANPRQLLTRTRLNPRDVSFQLQPFVSLDPQLLALRLRDLLHAPAGVALRIDHDVVHIGGHASVAWIRNARAQAHAIEELGVTWEEDGFVPDESIRFQTLRATLERQGLAFATGVSRLGPEQDTELSAIAGEIREMSWLARATGHSFKIVIEGHADLPGGSTDRNEELSRERASHVRHALAKRGVAEGVLRTEGSGATSDERRVDFRVMT